MVVAVRGEGGTVAEQKPFVPEVVLGLLQKQLEKITGASFRQVIQKSMLPLPQQWLDTADESDIRSADVFASFVQAWGDSAWRLHCYMEETKAGRVAIAAEQAEASRSLATMKADEVRDYCKSLDLGQSLYLEKFGKTDWRKIDVFPTARQALIDEVLSALQTKAANCPATAGSANSMATASDIYGHFIRNFFVLGGGRKIMMPRLQQSLSPLSSL